MKLNLGAGWKPKEGYTNVDSRALKGIDIVEKMQDLDFEEGSVEEVLFEDSFEHLKFREAQEMLQKIRKWLEPNGRLVIHGLPNMQVLTQKYNGLTGDGLHNVNRLIFGLDGFGEGDYEENKHLWGYSPEYMKGFLEATGFRDVKLGPRGELQFDAEATK